MYWRSFDLVSFVGMDFLFQKNVMSREDCSIRSLTPWLLMSQYVSVLLETEEWASCRLLYFRFCLSRASCCKLVKNPLFGCLWPMKECFGSRC